MASSRDNSSDSASVTENAAKDGGAGVLAKRSVSVDEAVALLKKGQLVALPTETVYGLAALASNPEAVNEVFKLKGRPADRPLIVHIASDESLDRWAEDIPDYARLLAKAFWPGPMALVLKRQAHVLDAVTGGQDSVALRVPNHQLTLKILDRLDDGLAAPSANRYGSISPTEPEAVAMEFGALCPAIVDGGASSVGVESTIVSCLGSEPNILRPGAVGPEEIEQVTGLSCLVQGVRRAGEVEVSGDEVPDEVVVPGQVLSHYAPKTRCVLLARAEMANWVKGWVQVWEASQPAERPTHGLSEDLDHQQGQSQAHLRAPRVGFLGYGTMPFHADASVLWPLQAEVVAQRLYRDLRVMDQQGLDLLVVEAVPESETWVRPSGLWEAIEDRLRRACSEAPAVTVFG